MGRLKIFKNKILPFILGSTILSTMSSCTISKSIIDKLEDNGINIEVINEYPGSNIYKITSYSIDGMNKFSTKNVINDYIETVNYDVICTPSEFSKYTGEYDLTWDDIRNTLDNTDLEDEYKSIILDGLNHLEEKEFNMDLAALNYNLKNLKIEYKDSFDEVLMGDIVAKFNADSQSIEINNNYIDTPYFKRTLIHELLGHGMTNAYYINEDGLKVYCKTSMYSCIIEDDKYKGKYMLGNSLEEALAEFISYYATGEKMMYDDTMYITSEYGLLLLCESNGIKIGDYANKGIEYLINKMKDNNLGHQINYIKCLDDKFNHIAFFNSDTNYKLEDVTVSYLFSLIDNSINKNKSIDFIKDDMHKLVNCYKPYIIPFKDEENDLTIIPIYTDFYSDYIAVENLEYYIDDYLSYYTYGNGIK